MVLLVDDILCAPFKSLFWLFKEIHQAAQQEEAAEADKLVFNLSELYMKLETGELSEEEFAAQEKVLLDRLDALTEARDGNRRGH